MKSNETKIIAKICDVIDDYNHVQIERSMAMLLQIGRILNEHFNNCTDTNKNHSVAINEDIIKYTAHLPNCNLKQDWSEVYAAYADTPDKFRHDGYVEYLRQLEIKHNTCTCGLKNVMEIISCNNNITVKLPRMPYKDMDSTAEEAAYMTGSEDTIEMFVKANPDVKFEQLK